MTVDFKPSALPLTGDQYSIPLYENCRFPFTPYSKVACCSFSGPIAVASLKGAENEKSFLVKIFAANGELLAQIEASHLYQLFWTNSQKLILLSKNGRVLVYTASGKSCKTFYMDDKTEAVDICSALVFTSRRLAQGAPTGLACLKTTGQLFAVNDVESPLLWRITDVFNRNAPPPVWSMLLVENFPMLVWWTQKDGFQRAGQGKPASSEAADWMERGGDYVEIVHDVELEFACLNNTFGVIQVVTTDLRELVYQFDLRQLNVNKNSVRIYWCKEEHVMLRTGKDRITCVSRGGESTEFPFHSEVHVCAEIDELHVFSHDSLHALAPVSSAMRHVLSLSSTEAAAHLFEAAKRFRARDPQVNEYFKGVGDRLAEATGECWTATLESRQPDEQSNLFAAAVFGQSLQKMERPDQRIEFSKHCKSLRLLRFLRQRGVPMSFAQLERLGVDAVIDRLWAFNAMDNVRAGFADELELVDRIVARFSDQKYASYAAAAEVAAQKGLQRLASRLLDLEEDVMQQVTTLLKLKQVDRALAMSAKSKDPDLLYMVIRHLRGNRNNKELELRLQKIPHVFEMYKNLTQEEDPDRLFSLYQQSDDFRRQALFHIASFPHHSLFDVPQLLEAIDKAAEALTAANAPQLAQLMAQHKKLVESNAKMEERAGGVALVDRSLRETFHWAVVHHAAYADNLRKQHRLSDKQTWLWTVDALAEAKLWDRLEHFARETRPPFGFLPLVRAFAKHGEKERALKFVDRVPAEDQAKAYALLGDVSKAAEVAFTRHDMNQLLQLRLQQPQESQEWAVVNSFVERAQTQAASSSAQR
ncbi:Vacuolar protein sorting-associated protein 16-like protein [Aphelenchoides fujianensis]|nr:Vacuolar protein sorting-associated protein 16-like protein [Aphelenchoides fujianensis]